MKREFLEGLGLEKEAIDKIMAEHGKGIESAKGDLAAKETELGTKETELQTLQGQLETANNEIESYKEMDIESIKAAADDYKEKFEAAKEAAEKEIEALKFEHSLENALNKAGAKNVKAAKALLDIESLKDSKNIDSDIETAIDTLKESESYLFGETKPAGVKGREPYVPKGEPTPINNPFSKEHLNLTEQGRLIREEPEEAKELMIKAGLKPEIYGL